MNRGKLKNFSLKQLILALTGGAITTIGAYFLYRYFKGNKLDSNNKMRLLTLTEDEAREREKIKNIEYNLYLQFNPDLSANDKYSGTVVVKFDLDNIDNNVFIDYAGYIVSLRINGKKVSINKEGERLILKKEFLAKNNLVIISFENFYSHINKGLTYYHEKSNSKSYVYTNIEPCYAHLVFPCFNQPSLKAVVNFAAGTMNDWCVHSSGELDSVTKSHKDTLELKSKLNGMGFFVPEMIDNYILHHFTSTEKIPIYLFGLFAGHFNITYTSKDEAQSVNVFLRKEFHNDEHNYALITSTVSKGYELFKSNLSSEISNKSITVCFVPNLDTKSVPCSRLLILDESLLTIKSSSLYNKNMLHLHLLATTAQQWFGVSVNPNWFDDIWISKGLACFLAFHFLKQISESNVETYSELCESWVIYSIKKQKAIEEDLYAKNHSLKADVIILSESLQNYDDITFFKGASIFKNFYNYIGPELFFKGLKNLFKSNKGGTINYEKFKETYKNLSNEREYKEDPVKFIDPFIVKSGINQVECVYELENEQISKCVIKQSSNGILHIHHDYNYITDICVVGKDDNETILKDVKIFNNEINELIGVKQPKCIILNINDSSYFVQKFDESTLNYLMNTYIKISKSSSKRILIAREIYEMVRSCNLSVQKFQKFCFNMMDTEEDQIVLEFIIETLIHSIENYTPLEYQHKLKEQLLNYIVDNYFTKFIQIKNTVVSVLCDLVEYNDISKLNDILSLLQILKNNKLMKLQSEEITSSQKLIDLDLSGVNLANRKKLLLLIFESSHLDMTLKNQYLDKILIEDEIDSDLKYILEASLPNNKSEIWGKLIDSNLNERRSLYIKMKGFNRKSQYSLIKSFLLNKFFDDFMSVKENRSLDYTLRFLRGLSPKDVIDKDVVTKFKNLRMKMNKKDHAIIYDLDKIIDSLEIRLKISVNYN